MLCQCRFINRNESTTVVQDVDNGKVVCVYGDRLSMGTLYVLHDFALGLKLL